MERWSGRVAVVTGASVGIGESISEELVKKGLKVVGLARRVDKVEELAKKLKSESGKLHALKCDVSKEDEVKAAFQWVKENFGRVDILINNAGVAKWSNLIEGPAHNWKTIIDLNVLGLSMCTTEALKIMKEKNIDDGHIIHINSVVGHTIGQPPSVYMYTASKHAVTVLTEGLRRELVKEKSKIRVTSLSPGLVKTEFIAAVEMPPGTIDISNIYDKYAHLSAKDITDCVLFVLAAPPHVQIHELTVIPVGQGAS